MAAKKKTTTKKAASVKKATPAKKTGGKRTSAKKPAAKKTTKGNKKMSALDAAAKVLGEAKKPLRAKELIETMAEKGYWKSPGGKTPHATLYAAMMREINEKGKDSRFKKEDRGLFAKNS